ncbi:MAG TPA: hypothetical protein VHX52_04170 [Steroidobacteraceae bacterium]|jgi:hypothetical protein|nr:hypothetical protein [Steroidobacteraceae bacterium]
MTALTFKPDPAAAGDKQIALPPLAATVRRRGEIRARRRSGVVRLVSTNLGFRPFRVN